MSDEVSKSWYTKYRPVTLDEYCGKRIKELISKRFKKRADMPHVMFLHGNRGCGKTTLCRILSKMYLCESLSEDGVPCEECSACRSINEILIDGNTTEVECPGVTELDATIMNGKEAIQAALDDAVQTPLYTEYKVLIVDECHMISPAGQNSMLKIIEDIPQHLIVMFATTDPQKVLGTIKSRCQLTIEVRKQTVEEMADRLMFIAQKEGLTVSKEALEIIAKKGDRVPRECINILENVAKTYDGEVTIDNVKAIVGGVASEKYLEYFKAANTSLGNIIKFIGELRSANTKYTAFISGLTGFVMDALYIKHGIALEEYPIEYVKAVKQLFDMYDSNDFDMLLQVMENLLAQAYDGDDGKIEMLLTITAMRVSKISLLANGLAEEQREGVLENKKSLIEHSKKLQRNSGVISERLKIDMDVEDLKPDFDDLTVVKDTGSLLAGLNVPDIGTLEPEKEENIEKKEDNAVDNFFDD